MAPETAEAAKGHSGSGSTTQTTPAAGETTAAAGETKPAAGETTAAAGETKPAAGEPAGDTSATKPASKDGAAPPAAKAPEKYALTLPEGGRLDAHDLAAIETIARGQGWTNDDAQRRINEHAAAIDAQSARFTDETNADPVYGGANLDASLKLAGAALDKLRPKGTPRGDGLRALLDKSGYGNHLEVVSLLADLGSLMAEDGNVGSTGGGGTETKDAATLIYGPDKK